MTPEFSRPQRLDQIGAGESQVDVTADLEERTALAKRFGLRAIDSLAAHYTLQRDAIGVIARGKLTASVVQSCTVTADPVPANIDEDFAIRFVPETADGDTPDEVELSESECDTVFFAGSAIDLGEATAETLALALDPYPRSPNAAETLKQAGVIGEDEVGPFSGLAALRDKLAKK
jgi:uncharacterized metal-binding protein YceD (DUF177 family)